MNEEVYPYPLVSDEGKVICQICGKPYLVISPRHLGTHNVSYEEYKTRFSGAPLSSKEFNKMGKIARDKNIFVEEELKAFEVEEPKEDIVDEDIPEKDVDPTVDQEIDFEQVYAEAPLAEKDICSVSKDRILDHLRAFFTNIRKDYMIQVFNINNLLMFEFISDFADPILKVNIQFPNAFWHNRMQYVDSNRDKKLEEHGWKVIRIKSKGPTFKDISKAVEKL